ncbi:MAG: hypothetical protein KGL93_02730, partial [Gemmatimonadota bacterium]|nr:hypothetical protein [Gemmatimonadota bacterium]
GDGGNPYAPLTQAVGYSAVALGMGALVGSAAGVWDGTPRVARWFSARSLRAAGRYSYALYVVHYPLMAVVDLAWARVRIPALFGSMLPAWLAYAAALLLPSFGIAWLSWRLVESRMLALKGRLPFGARPSAPRAA